MRTARSSGRPGGGGSPPAPPGTRHPAKEQTPGPGTPPGPGNPPLWTESQTPVKTLPCLNFVAGGNKYI